MATRTVADGCTVVIDGTTYRGGEKVTVTGGREKRLSAFFVQPTTAAPSAQPKRADELAKLSKLPSKPREDD